MLESLLAKLQPWELTTLLKRDSKRLDSSTIISQIHTKLQFHVQLSLLFCVISVDNKIYRGVELHKIQISLHVARILEMGSNSERI